MEIIKLLGKALYQWDTGRQVMINPPEGITVDEVHFAGQGDAVALVVLPKTTEEGLVADIPNILLQRFCGIKMWAVMRYPDGSERTVSSNRVTIIQRTKPEDYVYTETELLRYENLEKRIEALEKNDGGSGTANKKLTFTGAVTAEYDGSGAVTVTIPDGSIERIEKLLTDTEVELQPNKLYIFPEMESLSVTFTEASKAEIVNEYHFVFQSGTTATTLTLPDTVNIPSSFTVDASKIYEISIMESCMAYQSWEVTA